MVMDGDDFHTRGMMILNAFFGKLLNTVDLGW